ncbi:hypothetical protein DFQ28_000212 [Apophysomyces sp. BC1034]|nr:hypothetical protein DFQ28_000212 [Apophysomyces sp. BC1034]
MPSAKKLRKAKNEDFKAPSRLTLEDLLSIATEIRLRSFGKTKLKVGKKKALPDNFTDTSFKSKSISLPNQSITEDKSREITTSRNLTLADLVIQLKHYNANVRKDALSGLEELCGRHPELLVSSLSSVVHGLLKLFIDDDRDVRKSLLAFLRECFVPLDKADLQPFLPLLVIYTCSAMTHIFEDIRLDAIKLADLWVEIAPDVIVSKFWDRFTGNYISLLAVDSTSMNTSSTSSTPSSRPTTTTSVKEAAVKSHLHLHKSKLELLSGLSKFLEAGLSGDKQDKFWFLLNFLEGRHAKESFKQHLEESKASKDAKTNRWDPKSRSTYTSTHAMITATIPYISNVSTPSSFSSLNLFDSTAPKSQSSGTTDALKGASSNSYRSECGLDDRVKDVKMLIETFQPILISTWLETAPSVFSSSSAISVTPALQLLTVVMRLALILWRAMVSGGAVGALEKSWLDLHLQQLLKHLAVYFPYGADSFGNRGAKVDSILQEMNIMLCELTSLYLLARTMQRSVLLKNPPPNTNRKRRHEESGDREDDDDIPAWADRIVDHVFGILGYEENDLQHVDKKQRKDGSMSTMTSDFKSESLVSLLPAIWGFLNCLEGDRQLSMFKAFMGYYHHCHAHSASKRTALEFLIRLYLIQSMPTFNGRFHIKSQSDYVNLMQAWFLSLPKTLWQLKSSHLETSKSILNIMCDIAKRGESDIFDTKALQAAELTMVPFFYVYLANKGPLYGPFLQLPIDVQKRAVEFIYYVNSGSAKVQEALAKCREVS